MKIHRYILLSLLVGFSSCGNWLEVTPKDEVIEKDLYSQATGAYNILNGLYKAMAKPELYGRELTYGLIDAAGQVYNVSGLNGFWGDGITKNSFLYYAATFDYNYNAEIKEPIAEIWEREYKVIINANNLIYNVGLMDDALFKLGREEKNMILGEAYAIRALCHLDVLRLYAPAPATNPQGKYIRYSVESDVNKPGFNTENLTVDETLAKIEKDLLIAKDLIAPFDTLDTKRKERLGPSYRFSEPMVIDEIFHEFRGYRVNLLAANAILARAYNYWGKHDKAVECANFVLNFEYAPDSKAITFANGWNIRTDKKFKSDLIFALSYPKAMEDYKPYTNPNGGYLLTIRYYDELFVKYEFKDENDYRLYLLNVPESAWSGECYPLKNTPENLNEKDQDITPMIRLSEMYFIIADAYAAKGDFVNAQNTLNQIRMGRNGSEMNLRISDMASYKQRYLEEVKREFFQEGQVFFQYKKHNVLMTNKMSVESFNLPIPESQNI